MKPVFGRLPGSGAAKSVVAGLLRAAFEEALAGGGGWFSATSCAGLMGSSASRRTTSTLTGGRDGDSALAGNVAETPGGRDVPEAVAVAALVRGADKADTAGGEFEMGGDLVAAARRGGGFVAGGREAGGTEVAELARTASVTGRFVADGGGAG